MGTTDVLRSSIQHTHDGLTERLEAARVMGVPAGEPRLGYQRIDTFLAGTSKHLHAVDAVLLPSARKQLPEGGHVVHEYLHSAKEFEVALAHVKAHEYGSVYETDVAWPDVWDDVGAAMSVAVGLGGADRRLAHRGPRRRRAGAADRAAAGRRAEGAEPAAPVRPAHRGPRLGVAQGDARCRPVLGHRRGPDGPGARRPSRRSRPAGWRSTSSATRASTRRSHRSPRLRRMTRVAVLGGHGKTGRAVCTARAGRRAAGSGRLGRPRRRAMAGCDAAYLIAPNLHPDEPTYVAEALDGLPMPRT